MQQTLPLSNIKQNNHLSVRFHLSRDSVTKDDAVIQDMEQWPAKI